MQAMNRPSTFISESISQAELHKLPFAYESLRTEVSHRPVGFRFSPYIRSVVAHLGENKIVVCGEAETSDLAEAKAFSELMERSALISFAKQFKAHTSNGWAAHPDEEQARLNAILELVERDAVLAQWYSSTPFLEILQEQLPDDIERWAADELSRSEFPKLSILISTKGLGPSVTCIFQNDKGHGVSAHSTKISLEESIKSAIAEACRAAHATIRREHWQDTLRLKEDRSGRVEPGAHGVYYAYHEAFPRWMFGPQLSWIEVHQQWQMRMRELMNNICDFSYTAVLNAPLAVGFARHPHAFGLNWGATSTEEIIQSPGAKRIHLTFKTTNGKPHIVS